MKRLIVGLTVSALIVMTGPQVHAQDPAPAAVTATATIASPSTASEREIEQVSIAPDSIFYSLKLFFERLRTAITVDAAERAELLTQQATTRLAEAKLMMEAGKADLAQAALRESQQKFQQAQSVVATAVAAGKQLDSLHAQLEKNEARFTVALDQILVKSPPETKPQVEAAVTDVIVQLAATRDSVVPDAEMTKAAQTLIAAIQNQVGSTKQAESLPPRILLALEAISHESGEPLAKVLGLYQELQALGDVALELKVKMESVQTGARVKIEVKGDKLEIEIKEADGTETEIKLKDGAMQVKVEAKDEDEDDDDKEARKDRKVKLEFKRKQEKKGCKEHPVFKVHPGRGQQCQDGTDNKDDDRDDDRDDEKEDK